MNQFAKETAEKVIAFYLARAEAARAMARKCRNLDEREEYLNVAFSWLSLAVETEQARAGVVQRRLTEPTSQQDRPADPPPHIPADGILNPSSSNRIN